MSLIASRLPLLFCFCFSSAYVSRLGQLPFGSNPLLYSYLTEPILHLDERSFSDSVYQSNSSFLVQFYADWCGHCRNFRPYFSEFARQVQTWSPLVKIAVVNCADSFNDGICRENNVKAYPTIKYFPRQSLSVSYGQLLTLHYSAYQLKYQLINYILNEYKGKRPTSWPNFQFLPNYYTIDYVWPSIPLNVQHLLIIFEPFKSSNIGAEVILELNSNRNELISRRALLRNHLARMLYLDMQTIYLVVYQRGQTNPVHMAKYNQYSLNDVKQRFLNSSQQVSLSVDVISEMSKKIEAFSCDSDPQKCKQLYYVSESDMLKAMKQALFRDTSRIGKRLKDEKLTSLINFLDLLSNYFPQSTTTGTDGRYLYTRFRWPFQKNVRWQHCKGSLPSYRGYTCGLWTTFHSLTVNAYKYNMHDANFRPLSSLKAIQSWVDNFFGCRNCRDHFMNMTTMTFPMEKNSCLAIFPVHQSQDVVLYLWKAHNIVNGRLKGDNTEDPQFIKRQFPARFLCKNCTDIQNQFDNRIVLSFLMSYYSDVEPNV